MACVARVSAWKLTHFLTHQYLWYWRIIWLFGVWKRKYRCNVHTESITTNNTRASTWSPRPVCRPCQSIWFCQLRTLIEDTEIVWNTRQPHYHPKKLHTNVTYIMKVWEEEVEINGTVLGVKQGDNLGPILCILLIQAVASILDKKWTFTTPDFQKYQLKKDGNIAYNPSLKRKVPKSTIGTSVSFNKSYYVDDAAYAFLSQKDIEDALKLIKSHFTRFGLTVHCGDRRNDGK